MTSLNKVSRYDFLVEPFHCDFAHNIFPGRLGNMMLNTADFHSDERGFGMSYLNTIDRTWVLSRLVIEMTEMPKAYSHITIATWMDKVMKSFTSRNYAVTGADGKVYGYGRSIWAMIDTSTRQPVDTSTVHDGLITSFVEEQEPCPIEKPSRVKIGADAQTVRTIDTHYSDVDVNGHINSVKYIEHMLDLWDIDWYRQYDVRRIDMAYVAEAYYGDRLSFMREKTAENEYCVRIVKIDSVTQKSIEVCRSKIIFIKK